MNYELVLLAAGQSRRMKASKNKILIHMLNKPVIEYALDRFVHDEGCQHIVLVVEKNEKFLLEELIQKNKYNRKKPITLVIGGKERQDSVNNGLKWLKNKTGIVMIHDGARPFIESSFIQTLYQEALKSGAAILGVPVKDTIKKVVNNKVLETVPRELLWQIQTPQAFDIPLIQRVHQNAEIEGFFGTDDASLVEHYGQTVSLVEGSYENIKLTTPDDLIVGEAILMKRAKYNLEMRCE